MYLIVGLLIAIFGCSAYAGTSLTPGEVEICTQAHNKLRALHTNTIPLEWDDSLAAKAQVYAEELIRINQASSTNKLIHEKPSGGMGENLYWQDNKKKGTCADASLAWYLEINDYSYASANTKNGKPIGHFTQMVWTKTVKFGVGIATMKSRKYSKYGNIETYIVAKYSPPGNFYMTGKRKEYYTAYVQPRIAGSKTPTVEELDPTLKAACENTYGNKNCNDFIDSWGYSCKGDEFESYFKENCFKKCGYC